MQQKKYVREMPIYKRSWTTGGFQNTARERESSEKLQIELQITVNQEMIPGPLRAGCHGNVIIAGTALICGSLLS